MSLISCFTTKSSKAVVEIDSFKICTIKWFRIIYFILLSTIDAKNSLRLFLLWIGFLVMFKHNPHLPTLILLLMSYNMGSLLVEALTERTERSWIRTHHRGDASQRTRPDNALSGNNGPRTPPKIRHAKKRHPRRHPAALTSPPPAAAH